ncbi:DUF6176 family protein [Alloscardovia venturai]|uniref:DUF6176 family protein n=1 Tax=Alloscardovia venturai TaxID=1769421 RepID=A0ABW2Y4N1_9BIFI
MRTELTRFRVLPGKSAVVDEWMAFLNNHMPDTLLTLENEKMYVESIFREIAKDGTEYLYWFSIQGLGGASVEDSDSYIDKKHLEYWDKCIDPNYGEVNFDEQVVMIPERIRAAF